MVLFCQKKMSQLMDQYHNTENNYSNHKFQFTTCFRSTDKYPALQKGSHPDPDVRFFMSFHRLCNNLINIQKADLFLQEFLYCKLIGCIKDSRILPPPGMPGLP